MLTPAQKHMQKALAKKNGEAEKNRLHSDTPIYKITFAALVEDRRRLSDIQSVQNKIASKHKMLPHYQGYIDGVLESGTGDPDEIVTTLMVWHIDVGDLARAAEIGRYVIEHNLESPDQYKRTSAALLAEECALHVLKLQDITPEWQGGAITNQNPSLVHALHDIIENVIAITHGHDMHDPIQSQLYKAMGFINVHQGQYPEAIEALNQAMALNEAAGVKRQVENLSRLATKLQAQVPTESEAQSETQAPAESEAQSETQAPAESEAQTETQAPAQPETKANTGTTSKAKPAAKNRAARSTQKSPPASKKEST